MNTTGRSGDVTLCITSGGRPLLLERTLRSLLSVDHGFAAAVITNDAGDEETNEVVRRYLPEATLIVHSERRGQLASVDEMYAQVKTPFIFHCEDDWEFDPVEFIDKAMTALVSDNTISVVCVRQSGCMIDNRNGTNIFMTPAPIPATNVGNATFVKLPMDAFYSSFTFNPTLLRTSLWKSMGGYRQIGLLNGEGSIDRHLHELGLRTAHLLPGVCFHIGQRAHVDDPFLVSRRRLPKIVRAVRELGRASRRALGLR